MPGIKRIRLRDRNIKLVREFYRAGHSFSTRVALSLRYDINLSRVYQIVRAEEKRAQQWLRVLYGMDRMNHMEAYWAHEALEAGLDPDTPEGMDALLAIEKINPRRKA